MASLSEIIQLCRLCLVKDHVNISIFDDPENVRQIPLKISSCLPVKISRDDNLPKKICDGCSSKLDLCYDFWTSTAQAEKTLLCMAKEKENQVPEAVIPQPLLLKVEPAESLEETQICEPPVPKPIIVKKEVEPAPTSVENEAEEPAAKRPRRSAAIKAQMQIAPESDDDDAAEGLCTTEDVADVEDDIEDPDIPDMNVEIDDVKPGPSGLNQRSADSEFKQNMFALESILDIKDESSMDIKDEPECVSANYHCLTCQVTFYDLYGIEEHPNQSGCRYFCELCDREFGQKSEIIIHAMEHNNMDDKFNLQYHATKKSCPKCCEYFESFFDLSTHLLRYHTDKKTLRCYKCDASFSSKYNLRRHIRRHIGEKLYKCPDCGKCYFSKYSLNVHLSIHTGKKPFTCSLCDKSFARKSRLDRHSTVHSDERPYKCTMCDKTFKRESDLTNHFRSHTGDKPYKCNKCDKSFPAYGGLQRHEQTHTGEKPYKCEKCEKSFLRGYQLRSHQLRVHASTKNYICADCGKGYTHKRNMVVHFRKTHTGRDKIVESQ